MSFGVDPVHARAYIEGMLELDSVITMPLLDEDYFTLEENSEKACIGGTSQVRASSDRTDRLFEDQFVGQAGHLIASRYLFGTIRPYLDARDYANKNPHEGDDGSDFLNIPGIDVKTSMMRASTNPLDYRVLVRPNERHKDNIYVQALLQKYDNEFVVHLVGWCEETDLPRYIETKGVFRGAYVLGAKKLKPMEQIQQVVREVT